MTSRELFNGIMQAMDTQSTQIGGIAEHCKRIDKRIDDLAPQNYLPMIARPVQGVDYSRTCNVSKYVDERVKEYNEKVSLNAPRYFEFAPGRSHDDLNRSALATIGGILVRKFGNSYGGHKTWEKLYRARPQACEEVLEEARLRPELRVFAQVDGQWCLRELAKNKIKSLMRGSRTSRLNEVSPMTGPDVRREENAKIVPVTEQLGAEQNDGVVGNIQESGRSVEPYQNDAGVQTEEATDRTGLFSRDTVTNSATRSAASRAKSTATLPTSGTEVTDTTNLQYSISNHESRNVVRNRAFRGRSDPARIRRAGLSSRNVRPRLA